MIVIGLTGSIGMGKSVTANLFRAAGAPVHDSDATVHRLYSGPDAALIELAFPGVVRNGGVDRQALAGRVLGDEEAMKRLEAIVHPWVEADRQTFRLARERDGVPAIVFDIPLLFETGSQAEVDVIVVVDAKEEVQKSRVLARPGMTLARFESIIGRQTPSIEKRRRAHFVIDTSRGVPFAARQVRALLRALTGKV